MNLRTLAIAAALAGTTVLLYCLWLWQPERQVLKHHQHLLDAASTRSWTRLAGFIDDKFTDRWGYDKTEAISESRQVLGQFFSLTITGENPDCFINDSGVATVSARLKFQGNGTAVADYAKNEVNALTEPFVFQWTRKSWKPWDWALIRVDQSQLNLDRMQGY